MWTTSLHRSADATLIAAARDILARTVPDDLRDDRFDDQWAQGMSDEPTFRAALAVDDGGDPIGYLGGAIERSRLQLEALVVPDAEHRRDVLGQMVASATAERNDTASIVEVWARPADRWHDEVLEELGFVPERELYQMRCPLPVDRAGLPTRAFIAGTDEELLRAVNNRAFAGHPDQGALSEHDLAEKLAQPWVRPDGIRLHEIGGRLAGFCWTKIHEREQLGEIYTIAVDPDFHGRGLGVPMTAAGLHWLSDQGLTTGMLYVESNNAAAVRTYRRLGFAVVRADRAWTRPL